MQSGNTYLDSESDDQQTEQQGLLCQCSKGAGAGTRNQRSPPPGSRSTATQTPPDRSPRAAPPAPCPHAGLPLRMLQSRQAAKGITGQGSRGKEQQRVARQRHADSARHCQQQKNSEAIGRRVAQPGTREPTAASHRAALNSRNPRPMSSRTSPLPSMIPGSRRFAIGVQSRRHQRRQRRPGHELSRPAGGYQRKPPPPPATVAR